MLTTVTLEGRDASTRRQTEEKKKPRPERPTIREVPDELAGGVALRCSKCGRRLVVSIERLVTAARARPTQATGFYLADRGEVVYRFDSHAEELARRDRRAATRKRQASYRPQHRRPVAAQR
ncbi:MAG TPA: hypothetical protein VEH29_02335 [Acidimicrobiales bacterium]|nr:hypothetical protein [Acidimicrobiales bacterium]